MGKYRHTDDGVVQGVAYVKTGFLGLRKKKVFVELKNGGLLTVSSPRASDEKQQSLKQKQESTSSFSGFPSTGRSITEESSNNTAVKRSSGRPHHQHHPRAGSLSMSRAQSRQPYLGAPGAIGGAAFARMGSDQESPSIGFEKSLSIAEYRVRESTGSLKVKVEGRSLSFAAEDNSFADLQRLSGSLRKAGAQRMSEFYTLDDLIGQGAYAKVYAGAEKKSGEKVAVKVLVKKKNTPGVTESINNEVEIVRMLDDHENIVRVLDVFETEYEARIVLEYMDGGSLFDLMMKSPKKRLKESAAARLVAHVLSGVAYLHGMNVIHGDIKAENILLTAGPDSNVGALVAKIADFGLSSKLESSAQKENGVERKIGRGTAEYMSPELSGECGERGLGVDVWACGVLLYVLLSGQYPFHGSTPDETRKHVVDGRVVFPSATFAHVSSQAIELVRKLLTRDPLQRPSAQEALSDPWFESNGIRSSSSISASGASPRSATNALTRGLNILHHRR